MAPRAWAPGEARVLDLRDGPVLPSPSELSAIVISGSAAYLADAEPWMLRGLEFLRAAVAAEVPTLGVCFGHQMLGAALGGVVGRNPAGREIGSAQLEVLQASELLPAGRRVVNASHLDSILALPPGAVCLGRTELEPHALVRFGARAWGVQFHPEFDAEITRAYIEARAQTLAGEGLDPIALRDEVVEGEGGVVLPNFFSGLVDGVGGVR